MSERRKFYKKQVRGGTCPSGLRRPPRAIVGPLGGLGGADGSWHHMGRLEWVGVFPCPECYSYRIKTSLLPSEVYLTMNDLYRRELILAIIVFPSQNNNNVQRVFSVLLSCKNVENL